MQTLAAVMADGSRPLDEVLVENVGRLRRGMTAVIITPSLDAHWVRPLGGLRTRGVETAVILLDAPAFAAQQQRADEALPTTDNEAAGQEAEQRAARALRHALAEHDLRWHSIVPAEPIGTQLVSRGPRPTLVVSR